MLQAFFTVKIGPTRGAYVYKEGVFVDRVSFAGGLLVPFMSRLCHSFVVRMCGFVQVCAGLCMYVDHAYPPTYTLLLVQVEHCAFP